MKYLKSFKSITEAIIPNIELNNEVKEHLSQYPFLNYSIKDLDNGIELKFGNNISTGYVKGLLDPFIFEFKDKKQVLVIITGKKKMDDSTRSSSKPVIGNLIYVDIPHLKIKNLPAKCDTGATTSSLHCETINIDKKKGTVTFKPLDSKYEQYQNRTYTFPIDSQITVQSSNGDEEVRPMIKIDIIIDNIKHQTYITLADREELQYPILLGKDLLSNFLIDVGVIEDNIKKIKD